MKKKLPLIGIILVFLVGLGVVSYPLVSSVVNNVFTRQEAVEVKNRIKMKHSKIKPLSAKEKMTIQLWLGVILAVTGIILLWVGLFLPPLGVIDASVLTGIGEVFTFSGSLIGIDYSYKFKEYKLRMQDDEENAPLNE
jgi:hypothetical protein